MARFGDATKNGKSATDETTPLLVTSEAGPTAPSNEEPSTYENEEGTSREDDDTPLPKLQIALLCYARLVEPIAFFSIFPFINTMIEETGHMNETEVGFYAGLIVCDDSLHLYERVAIDRFRNHCFL